MERYGKVHPAAFMLLLFFRFFFLHISQSAACMSRLMLRLEESGRHTACWEFWNLGGSHVYFKAGSFSAAVHCLSKNQRKLHCLRRVKHSSSRSVSLRLTAKRCTDALTRWVCGSAVQWQFRPGPPQSGDVSSWSRLDICNKIDSLDMLGRFSEWFLLLDFGSWSPNKAILEQAAPAQAAIFFCAEARRELLFSDGSWQATENWQCWHFCIRKYQTPSMACFYWQLVSSFHLVSRSSSQVM